MARGDLKFRLHGEKLNGDFAIVLMKGRGKGNEWLLIKKRDEFAAEGWDVEALRVQRAFRAHPAGDREQSAGAQDQAQNGRRRGSRVGEQPSGETSREDRRSPAAKAAPAKKKLKSTSGT